MEQHQLDSLLEFAQPYIIEINIDDNIYKKIKKLITLLYYYAEKKYKNKKKKISNCKEILILLWTILNLLKFNPIYIVSDTEIYIKIPIFYSKIVHTLDYIIKFSIEYLLNSNYIINTDKELEECPVFFRYKYKSYDIEDELKKISNKFLVRYKYLKFATEYLDLITKLYQLKKPKQYNIEFPIIINKNSFYYEQFIKNYVSTCKPKPKPKHLWKYNSSIIKRHKYKRQCYCKMCKRRILYELVHLTKKIPYDIIKLIYYFL